MSEIFVTVEAAAPALSMRPHALYRALREGQLPTSIRVLRIGRQYRLHAGDLGIAPMAAGPKNNTTDNELDANQVSLSATT